VWPCPFELPGPLSNSRDLDRSYTPDCDKPEMVTRHTEDRSLGSCNAILSRQSQSSALISGSLFLYTSSAQMNCCRQIPSF
jgi:hypothetical protein